MTSKLVIRKVVDPPKVKDKPLHPNLPQPPALLLLVMPVKSGKSTIISNLLLNDDFYGQDYFDLPPKVISPTINNDLTSRFLKKACDVEDRYDDQIILDFVKSQQKFGEASDMPSACICVDDCLGEKTTALDNLASRYRHKQFRELYKQATKTKYSFLHLNLQENPAEAWVMFNSKIYPLSGEPEPDTPELDVEVSDPNE